MAGVAVVIILSAMAGSWLFRELLLRALRNKHPQVFAELGHPSSRNLASILPGHGNQQVRFWKYLWGGSVFRIHDKVVSGLALAALLADIGLAVGIVVLLGSPGK